MLHVICRHLPDGGVACNNTLCDTWQIVHFDLAPISFPSQSLEYNSIIQGVSLTEIPSLDWESTCIMYGALLLDKAPSTACA